MNSYRTMKVGDLEPAFDPVLYDGETGVALDLSVAAGITVSAAQNGLVLFSIRAASGDAGGKVTMAWLPGDTAVAGEIDLEVYVEWTSGRVQTFPAAGYFAVQVVDDLGSGPLTA